MQVIQLIIHHDDGRVEVAAQGTWTEVNSALSKVVSTLDPETAVWEFKSVAQPYDVTLADELSRHMLGRVDSPIL